MINELTVKQEQQLVDFKNKCLKIGLSTEKINREKNKEGINFIYNKYLKLENPYIWYVDSPLMYNLIINILPNLKDTLWDNLEDNLWENFRDNLRNNLGDNLEDNLEENLGANLRDNLWANLRVNLRENLWENFGENLGDNLRNNLGANLRNNLRANLGANLRANLKDNLWDNLGENLWENIEDNLWANLRANLEDNLWDNLGANLRANLKDNLWDNLRANLGENIEDNLENNLGVNLEENLRANLWDTLGDKREENISPNIWANIRANLWDNFWGNIREFKIKHNIYWSNLDIYWIAFYMFPKLYLKIDYGPLETDLEKMYKLMQNTGCFFCHKNICFVSERPIEINKKGIQLHSDIKPAVLFQDGLAVWCLNGVKVPKKIVITSSEKLDCKLVLKEKNAEVRREIIRKIGIERVIKELGATLIDKKGNYELLNFDIDGRKRPYLKMLNPSLNTWHVEGVHPSCDTVENALAWRDGEENYKKPVVLT